MAWKTKGKNKSEDDKYLTDIYYIKPGTKNWEDCDTLCYKSKNLYNRTVYEIRQYYFRTQKYLNYSSVQKTAQEENWDCYRALNTKNSQLIMKQIDTDFSSFFAASKAYKKDPSKFQGFPRPPNYKHKKGRSTLTFNIQTISGKWLKKGYLLLSGLTEPIKLNVQPDKIKEARIVPGQGGYKVEVVYKIKETKKKTTGTYKAGLDPGVNIMAAIVTNKKGENTFTISGGPIKSINQFYNKRKAELQSEFDLTNSNRRMKEIEKELDRLFWKRFHKIEDYLHKSSSALVNQLVSSGVDELVIGNNPEWKQEANMKRVENQNFCMFPHDRFYKKLEYKCELVGIKVKYEQEAYTSKCSFLDMEEIGKHEKYAGKRIKRGLFKSSKGIKINADVNGSGNILRKGIDGAFDQWSEAELIEGFVVNPIRLVVDPVRERTGKKFQRQKCH